MNTYLDQLLEAYETLYEQAEELDPQAEQAAMDAAKKASKYKMNNPYNPIEKLYVFATSVGKINFSSSPSAAYNKTALEVGGRKGKFWPEFVSKFGGKQAEVDPAKVRTEFDAGSKIMNTPFGDEESIQTFKKMAAVAPQIFKKLTEVLSKLGRNTDQQYIKNDKVLRNYLAGAREASLESQIASTVSFNLKEGKAITTEHTKDNIPDVNMAKGVIRNLGFFIDKVTEEDLADDAKKELLMKVARGSDGTFTVFSEGSDTEGLVFKDGTKFLDSLALVAEDKHGISFRSIDIDKIQNDKVDTVFRSLSFEKILPMTVAVKQCIDAKIRKDPLVDSICQSSENMARDYKGKIAKLVNVHRGWVAGYHRGERAVTSEDKQVVDAIAELVGDTEEFRQTMTAILSMSKDVVNTRYPDFVANAGGGSNTIGESTDNLEIWVDKEAAIKGLMSQGFSRQDSERKLVTAPASVAFKDDKDSYKYALSTRRISKNTEVYIHSLDLKNYMSYEGKGAKVGELQGTTIDKFYSGSRETPVYKSIREVTKTNLAMSDNEWDSAHSYHKTISNIDKKVRSLPFEQVTKSPDGSDVETTPLKDTVSNLLDVVKRNSTYGQITTGERASLVNLMSDSKKGNEGTLLRARERISTFLQTKKMFNDANDPGNTDARYYLASRFFLPGGSGKDGTTLSMRSLKDLKTYVSNKNATLSEPINSWLKGSDDWKLTMGSMSKKKGSKVAGSMYEMYLTNIKDPSRFIVLDQGSKSVGGDRQLNSRVYISKGQAKHHSIRTKKPTTESVLESMIHFQSRLVEFLSNIGRKSLLS